MNGYSHEDIMTIFSEFGSIGSLNLIPHSSYSFLEYVDEEMSRSAFGAINGQPLSTVDPKAYSNQALIFNNIFLNFYYRKF